MALTLYQLAVAVTLASNLSWNVPMEVVPWPTGGEKFLTLSIPEVMVYRRLKRQCLSLCSLWVL